MFHYHEFVYTLIEIDSVGVRASDKGVELYTTKNLQPVTTLQISYLRPATTRS